MYRHLLHFSSNTDKFRVSGKTRIHKFEGSYNLFKVVVHVSLNNGNFTFDLP